MYVALPDTRDSPKSCAGSSINGSPTVRYRYRYRTRRCGRAQKEALAHHRHRSVRAAGRRWHRRLAPAGAKVVQDGRRTAAATFRSPAVRGAGFVANFEGDQQVRFLQITAQIMTHDPKTVEELKAADPILRNDLLLLFSNQKAADLSTNDGKEKLRAAALAAVRKVLAANDGKPEKVDAVLFTTFVMQ
jgi:flagellar basal body-associated protein FliL